MGERMSEEDLRRFLLQRVAEMAGCAESAVDEEWSFAESGVSSRDAVVLAGEIEERVHCPISPTILWEYPTIASLARHLAAEVTQ